MVTLWFIIFYFTQERLALDFWAFLINNCSSLPHASPWTSPLVKLFLSLLLIYPTAVGVADDDTAHPQCQDRSWWPRGQCWPFPAGTSPLHDRGTCGNHCGAKEIWVQIEQQQLPGCLCLFSCRTQSGKFYEKQYKKKEISLEYRNAYRIVCYAV